MVCEALTQPLIRKKTIEACIALLQYHKAEVNILMKNFPVVFLDVFETL